jgi:predicted ABC-type ATPase
VTPISVPKQFSPLGELLGKRPLLIALAGPNGAGKSTFYAAQLVEFGLTFVNADVLALTASIAPYEAAKIAGELRRRLLAERESFIFETVFSDRVGDKVEFLKEAERAGYAVLLIFIGIDGPEQSDQRVAMRVSQGGHDVPAEKLVERYPRVLKNLKRALDELQNVLVYDNSNLDESYRLAASRLGGDEVVLHGVAPKWLKGALR